MLGLSISMIFTTPSSLFLTELKLIDVGLKCLRDSPRAFTYGFPINRFSTETEFSSPFRFINPNNLQS